MFDIILRRKRFMIGVRMIETEQFQIFLSCSLFGFAILVRGNKRPLSAMSCFGVWYLHGFGNLAKAIHFSAKQKAAAFLGVHTFSMKIYLFSHTVKYINHVDTLSLHKYRIEKERKQIQSRHCE